MDLDAASSRCSNSRPALLVDYLAFRLIPSPKLFLLSVILIDRLHGYRRLFIRLPQHLVQLKHCDQSGNPTQIPGG